MATRVYFMINVAEEYRQDGYQDILRDLRTIPEIKAVERVSGECDLLVKAEVPVRMIFIAHKLRAKEWVKSLQVLRVEPMLPDEYQELTPDELIWLKGVAPAEVA